ncbi:MAG: DUF4838 domain-containing protein [Clostridiales bacterium]|nr:DUF4838 domain-containing protein [Clostridiales bacterium]
MLAGEEGTLTVTLAVRPDREAGLPDRFSVELSETEGSIIGNNPRSVLLGVYDCLRRLGCRFLAPVEGCEVVPPITRGALPLRYEHRASFRHRGVCIEGADSRENVLDFIDWLPKLGYNSFFLQFKSPYIFYARWYQHRGNPLLEPSPFSPADALAWAEEAERELKRRGLLLHKVGHGWTGEVLGREALSWDSDTRPLAEDKRPLAAQVGGTRGLFNGVAANTNLCFHSGDAADSFAALVTDYARENPNVDYLHVWLADEYNNVCECEGCRRTTPTDQYVELLNEIDRRLTAQGLDTRIVFLLYQELLWPPVRARLAHPERFVLMFAPISRTFERSYEVGGGLPPIPPYERNQVELPTALPQNLAFLRGWQEVFQGDSFIYDYPLGRAHYGDFGYMKLARVMGGDVKRLGELGLDGYISCQELRSGLPNFFPNYVLGRALMDASLDVNGLMGEYFAAAYGEDWPVVADFLFQLSELSNTDYANGKGPRRDEALAARMDAVRELCLDFTPTLDAHRTPQGWQTPFWHVLDFHREYVLKLARAWRRLAQGDGEGTAEGWQAFRQLIRENEPDFQPWLDVYRVLEVTEKYTGFQPREN